MGLTLTGLAGTFDWQSAVTQLRQVETQQRIDPLNTQKTNFEDKLTAWNTIGTKLSNLLSAVKDLKDTSDFDVFKPTLSTNSSKDSASSFLSVTAETGAARGSYDIQIEQLATVEKLKTVDAFESKTTANQGWSSFYIEGQEISLNGTESLEGIRDKINQANTGSDATGVTASILKDQDGQYILTLTKDEAGSSIDFDDPSTGIASTTKFDTTSPLQTAQTAKFSIDGMSYENASNTVEDVIPGVTLNLLKVTGTSDEFEAGTAASVTVDVDRDESAIQSKVQTFVDKYNDLIDFIGKQNTYNQDTKSTGGALFGDNTLKQIKSKLQSTILDGQLSKYGVSFDESGKLSVDSEDFSTALSTDFSSTVSAFTGMAQSLDTSLDNLTDSIDGTVTMQSKSAQSSIDRLTQKIDTTQTRIDHNMQMLTNRFISMDSALSMMQSQSSYLSSMFSSS